jgi:hypothetical protein
MLTEQEAIEKAKAWLSKNLTSFEGREIKVTRAVSEHYTVVFPTPPDTLGGDFTIVVDASTGEVLDAKIER